MTVQGVSIRRKLVAIIMLSSIAALLLACGVFMVYELADYRRSLTRELTTMAQIVAESSTAALAFGDAKAAQQTLWVMRAEPRVISACIYGRDGTPFAKYFKGRIPGEIPKVPGPDGAQFLDTHLVVFQPVMLEGDRIGTVFLNSELTEMRARIRSYAAIGLGVMALSSLVALGLSARLQGLISKPILELAATASQVRTEKNYAARANKLSDDEIGLLADRFNEMMAEIQARDLALRNAQDQLEKRVEERTRELQEEVVERRRVETDLLAAKLAAEESNRAKSAFLANMSHELRTPLNAIIGYSELLEEEAGDDPRPDPTPDLRRIRKAGSHLLALINDVLDLSKIEAGRMEVRLERVSVKAVLEDVAGTAEPLARTNRNRFVAETMDVTVDMVIDVRMFRQSVLNLLANAFKFTENGMVTLRVRRTTVDGRRWLFWQVCDTGIGISPDQMHRLFEPFSQGDSSVTRRYGGTGLGLAISRRMCVMMGGDITVESTPGAGSMFTIHIPEADRDPLGETDEPAQTMLARLSQSVGVAAEGATAFAAQTTASETINSALDH